MSLKDRIKNLAGGDANKAQILLRVYMMERFLERLSRSRYRDNFVLKGGVLVSSLVGIEYRTTMDIDSTIRSLTLDQENAKRIIEEIARIPLEDGVSFEIQSEENIMEDLDYPGIRFVLIGRVGNMRQPIKIDLSTGDPMTPSAIEFPYRLMLEERSIGLLSYNLETLLAEKLETAISRGKANTRMRDFYDIHMLYTQKSEKIDLEMLALAFLATCGHRGTLFLATSAKKTLESVAEDKAMEMAWRRFQRSIRFAEGLTWEEVNKTVHQLWSLMEKKLPFPEEGKVEKS